MQSMRSSASRPPPEFFDDEHAQSVNDLLAGFTARSEWPTWLLIVTIYGVWMGTLSLLHARMLSLPMATPILIVALAWYMSLQHELLHGHPTRSLRFNKLLGFAPIAVWYPYTLYRDMHLAHHRDELLTVPGVDPESNYVDPQTWDTMSPLMQALWKVRKTFVGRFVVGPPMAVWSTYSHAVKQLLRGERRYRTMWLVHGIVVTAVLTGIARWAGVPVWFYLLAIAWPALSLAMVRSFYEHRAAPTAKARIALNEAGLPMRLLYLNNNYHLVHHDIQSLPWYLLPAVYRMRREAYVAKSGGFQIQGGYAELFQRYAFRSPDAPVHDGGVALLDSGAPLVPSSSS